MNHTEKYSDKELLEMKRLCVSISQIAIEKRIKDIHAIALIEINRELDLRKLRSEE